MKAARVFLMVALTILLLVKGIIPAFTTIGTDFSNYYTSSYVLVHESRNVERLYDSQWFSQRARMLGGPEGGIFQPFPPPTALLMVPLAFFDMRTAKTLWTVINLGILAALVSVLSRLSKLDYSHSFLVLLGSGFALINNFYLGQSYLLLTLCLAFSIRFYTQKKDVLSGILAGLFIPIKYFPLALVVFFLFEKRWIAAASTALAVLVVLGVSVLTLGPALHSSFLRVVLVEHLDGQMVNPFSATYQSWNSLLRSLFVKDYPLNPHPFVDWSAGFSYARGLVITGLTLVLLRAARIGFKQGAHFSFFVGILFSFALLVAPATATYHFLVLTIPVAILSSILLESRQFVPLALVLICFCGLGGVPAGALEALSLERAWKLLAYPRLYLLLGLFLTITGLVKSDGWHKNPHPISS
ncbi:MAG: hypothetical protein HW389_947 [Bacteroidetes bacterium]|nr:hypothetical protein [Bacteroidota bacterium]